MTTEFNSTAINSRLNALEGSIPAVDDIRSRGGKVFKFTTTVAGNTDYKFIDEAIADPLINAETLVVEGSSYVQVPNGDKYSATFHLMNGHVRINEAEVNSIQSFNHVISQNLVSPSFERKTDIYSSNNNPLVGIDLLLEITTSAASATIENNTTDALDIGFSFRAWIF